MKLIGLTEFKQRAGLTATGDDAMLSALLDSVSTRIEGTLGRTLTQAQYTEVLRPNGRMVTVKAYPVLASPAPIVMDYQFLVAATDYDVDATNGVIMLRWRPFTMQFFTSVTITYTGGYLAGGTGVDKCIGLPGDFDDLKDACVKQAKHEYTHRDRLGVQSESMGGSGGSMSLAPAEWLPVVKETFRGYRRFVLA